jgi:cysteine desulfurase/selenocysteine lyase
MNLDEVRAHIPASSRYVYLNHAACAPLPVEVQAAQEKYVEERALHGDVVYEEWIEKTEATRNLVADFIGGHPEEIAFLKNTSEGINLVATMLPLPKNANVVTTDLEFPSNFLPWYDLQRKGVEFRVVKSKNHLLELADFEKAIDDNTTCVAVSHVEFATGFKNDIKALSDVCSEHHAYFFVDPIQSLGALPFDVRETPMDFFSSACYKWLMSELGISIFYIKRELIDQFHPSYIGWFSLKDYLDYEKFDREHPEITTTARKFECGNLNFYGVCTLYASLQFLNQFSKKWVEERVLELADHVMDAVSEKGFEVQTPPDHAGIVNFKVKNPGQVVEALKARNIIVSSRAGGVRVSAHFWNTREEVDTLVKAVEDICC